MWRVMASGFFLVLSFSEIKHNLSLLFLPLFFVFFSDICQNLTMLFWEALGFLIFSEDALLAVWLCVCRVAVLKCHAFLSSLFPPGSVPKFFYHRD